MRTWAKIMIRIAEPRIISSIVRVSGLSIFEAASSYARVSYRATGMMVKLSITYILLYYWYKYYRIVAIL